MTPRWLGLHLVAVLAIAVCMGAGYWQFVRAQEPDRSEVSSPVQELAEARPLEQVTEPGAYMPESDGNTAVTAEGTYADTPPLLAPGRSGAGEPGYYVIAPLLTAEDTAVVVNRGWIPRADGEDGVPDGLPEPPEGEVSVTGWLQPPQKNDEGYSPIGVPEGHVARIAPSVLVNTWPYRLYEGYVVLGGQEPADTAAEGAAVGLEPVPPPRPEEKISWNWRNVSYAAQWGVFGLAVLVFWVSLIRRDLEEAAEGSGEDPAGGGPRDGGPDGGAPPPGPEGPAAEGGSPAEGGAPAGGGSSADGSGAEPAEAAARR
ncbi:SURF1 family protein [Nocardiopsis sp. CNT-189]